MATIQNLVGANKIKDEWQKINNNFNSLNSAKVEKSGDTMLGNLNFSGNPRGFRFQNGDVQTVADLADYPALVTADAIVRMFRNTNTTGIKIFQISKGDGTTAVAFQITNGEITDLNGRRVLITSHNGSPNGNVAAPPGSICLDTVNGVVYRKASGTGNTGWQAMA